MLCIIDNINIHINNMISFASDRVFASDLIAQVPACVIGNRKSKKQSLI
jgi:hypothetical protein